MGEGENGFDVINSRYVYLKKIYSLEFTYHDECRVYNYSAIVGLFEFVFYVTGLWEKERMCLM